MEIYVRLNDDIERDYAFQISSEDTINTKTKKIFLRDPSEFNKLNAEISEKKSEKDGESNDDDDADEDNDGTITATLADIMVLRPSIFHEYQPSSYSKSIHPGYLTEGGCLLFPYAANEPEYLEKLDENKPLFDQLWPGQLIVPQWNYNKKAIAVYALIIGAWLYTDLPDVVSPTPGICMSNQLSRMLIPILENHLDMHEIAAHLREEISINYSSVPAQWTFFFLHILKVSIITLFLYLGLANPLSFNPYKMWKLRNFDLSRRNNDIKNVLKAIGWIGSRKGTYDEYQGNFYGYMIKKYGGPVQAYRAGILRTAAAPGLTLGKNEGFQTPLDERFTGSTFKEIEKSGKFILSEEYFIELENDLKSILDGLSGDIGAMNEEIKRFRRFGLYEPGEKLQALVEKRKAIYKEEQKIIKEKEEEDIKAKKQK